MENDENVEVRVVLDSDAVVHPLAMVIKPLDALITNVAVARVCCANDLAVGAQQVSFELLD